MPEPSLRCPGCGAPAGADEAGCAYCGSALSTMTCAACFAPMFVGSRFCAHCGTEATRDLVDDSSSLHCPRCRTSLQRLRLGTTSAAECGGCGGLWLDPDALQRLVTAKEEGATIVSLLAARIPAAPVAPSVVSYIPCPRCETLMNRVNFAHASGVILDVCKTHGLWMDRGELQAVLHFVDRGGLTVARERERTQAIEDARHRALLAVETHRAPTPEAHEWNVPSHGELGGATAMVGRFLLGEIVTAALAIMRK